MSSRKQLENIYDPRHRKQSSRSFNIPMIHPATWPVVATVLCIYLYSCSINRQRARWGLLFDTFDISFNCLKSVVRFYFGGFWGSERQTSVNIKAAIYYNATSNLSLSRLRSLDVSLRPACLAHSIPHGDDGKGDIECGEPMNGW